MLLGRNVLLSIAPKMKITELPLKKELLKAVEEMGYVDLTPVQEKVLPILLAKKDVEAEAPTGTGKTACYSLPMLNDLNPNGSISGLVICPTRELAIQVVKEITKFAKFLPSIRTVAIYGGQSIDRQLKALKSQPSIIVGTPGRILDLLARRRLDFSHVNYLVLDECDEMLDMGFIRDIDKVIAYIKGPHQTSLFSATISPEIKKVSKKYLSPTYEGVKVERDLSHQHQIEQKYVEVAEAEKKDAIVTLINTLKFSRAFVFCRTKHKVMQIEKVLSANTNHAITSLQGNLSQNKRDRAMQDFRNYKCDVMVATDIAARGIDVSDVDLVVNYDVPEQDEFYLHRIGRTGRVEAKGTSFTFLTKSQRPLLRKYESMSNNTISQYILNKEGNNVIMNKYLESLAPLLKVNKDQALEEIQEACKEYSEKEGRTVLPVEIAAMMLVKQSTKLIEEPEAPKPERRPRMDVEARDVSSTGGQRFFINLGTADRLDEKNLSSYIIQAVPGLTAADFTDIYLKETFSFFTVDASKADAVLSGMEGSKFGDRDVRVKIAEPRDSSRSGGGSRGGWKPYQKKSYGDHKPGGFHHEGHSYGGHSDGASSSHGYASHGYSSHGYSSHGSSHEGGSHEGGYSHDSGSGYLHDSGSGYSHGESHGSSFHEGNRRFNKKPKKY